MNNFNLTNTFNNTFNPSVLHAEDIAAFDIKLFESLSNEIGRDEAIQFVLGRVTIDRHHEIEMLLVNHHAHQDVLSVYARIDELLLRTKKYSTKTII